MKSSQYNPGAGIFFPGLFIVFLLIVGKGITLSSSIPLILTAGMFLFLLGFLHTEKVMFLLIYAMLLSPEIIVGSAGSKDIVIRLEDMLIIIFFFAWLARTAIIRGEHFIFKTPIQRSIIFYCSIFILSTAYGIVSGHVRYLNGIFFILKYIEYFLIYYLVIALVKNKHQIKSYLSALILTFFIVCVYASTQIESGARVSAPFEGPGEPNTLGGYIILMVAVITGLLTHVKNMKWRWPLIAMTFFSMVPFAFTLSRASYIAFIPMYATLIFFNKSKTRDILIGLFIIVTILGIFFFPQNIKERIQYTFIPQVQETIEPVKVGSVTLGPSASARIRSWIQLYKAWKHKPIIGYGVTGLGFVDGQFVRTLAELGLVGLCAFIFLLVNIFRCTLRIYKNAKDDWLKGLALGFLAGHVGMVVHALTANTFIIIRIMEPYWFLAALVMMIPSVDDPQKLEENKPLESTSVQRCPRMVNFLVNSKGAAY